MFTIRVGEEDGVVLVQPLGHVVSVQHGGQRGVRQTTGAHHLDVRPRDGEDEGGAVRTRAHRPERALRAGAHRLDDRVRR